MKVNKQSGRILLTFLAFFALASCNSLDKHDINPTGNVPAINPLTTPTGAQATDSSHRVSTNEPTVTDEIVETPFSQQEGPTFNGENAYQHLVDQVNLGPRLPNSEGHKATVDLIFDHLNNNGWNVSTQEFEIKGVAGRNVIGKANQGVGPIIILGAHYDTRAVADRSEEPNLPVPGAVDGASGVAVLMELARVLDLTKIDREIWLTFFDLEDQGGVIPGLDFIEGSRYLADNLDVLPEAVVVVDMVGDTNQDIYYEGYSDPILSQTLWSTAEELGFGEYFIPEIGRTIRDDHLPFLQKGIPSSDIIDFNYPYWHTSEDTIDKSHPDSLYRVGRVLEHWLENLSGE